MPTLAEAAQFVEIIAGLIALAAGVKSAYNGTLRDLVAGLKTLARIENELKNLETRQQDLIDVVVALVYASQGEDVEVDPERTRAALDRDEGAQRFVDGSSSPLHEDD